MIMLNPKYDMKNRKRILYEFVSDIPTQIKKDSSSSSLKSFQIILNDNEKNHGKYEILIHFTKLICNNVKILDFYR